MRGIYDGSTTGKRSMLSRTSHPLSKTGGTAPSKTDEATTTPAPGSSRGADATLQGASAPKGAAGSTETKAMPVKTPKAANADLFMRFVAGQKRPAARHPHPPTPPTPASRHDQG